MSKNLWCFVCISLFIISMIPLAFGKFKINTNKALVEFRGREGQLNIEMRNAAEIAQSLGMVTRGTDTPDLVLHMNTWHSGSSMKQGVAVRLSGRYNLRRGIEGELQVEYTSSLELGGHAQNFPLQLRSVKAQQDNSFNQWSLERVDHPKTSTRQPIKMNLMIDQGFQRTLVLPNDVSEIFTAKVVYKQGRRKDKPNYLVEILGCSRQGACEKYTFFVQYDSAQEATRDFTRVHCEEAIKLQDFIRSIEMQK